MVYCSDRQFESCTIDACVQKWRRDVVNHNPTCSQVALLSTKGSEVRELRL